MLPAVSIGIAYFNPGSSLEMAIQSVFAQTFQDWELILVDDGSTDHSTSFIQSIKDSRVRYFCDGFHRRLQYRLNEITALARAPYLFRMDADDIMHPERIALQLAELRNSPVNTVLGTGAYSIDEASQILGMRRLSHHTSMGYSFIHPSVAANIEWWRANPYSQEPWYYRAEDAELWGRTASHTNFRYMPEPLLFYREHGPSSLEKYLGTAIGLVSIFYQRRHNKRSLYLKCIALEISKIWTMCVVEETPLKEKVIKKRFRSLTDCEMACAQKALDNVMKTPIPTITLEE